MSLLHAIRNCRKPIGSGKARVAYYSKKYDVVIKRAKIGLHSTGIYQNQLEAKMCNMLTESEKEIIPIISYLNFGKDNELVVIWKKVEPLAQRATKTCQHDFIDEMDYWWDISDYYNHLEKIILKFRLDNNLKHMLDIVEKYNLHDLKPENLGIMNNHLVILDCGWTAKSFYYF